MSLDWLYRMDELKVYSVNTEKGKERLEAFTKHLPNLLDTAGISLPREARVLCLFAGSCNEGIAYAQAFHADVTCLDLQQRMLSIGRAEARRRKLSVKTVKSDAKDVAKAVKGPSISTTIVTRYCHSASGLLNSLSQSPSPRSFSTLKAHTMLWTLIPWQHGAISEQKMEILKFQ